MDKESMIQAAESEWLSCDRSFLDVLVREEMTWHWFWLILAESIWPERN